jgi:hypothetical protein
MKQYSNNFVDLGKLKENGSVLVAKTNATYFLLTCKLSNVNVKFTECTGKVRFELNKL